MHRCVYVYIYIYIYIYTYVYTYVYTYMCVYIYIYIYKASCAGRAALPQEAAIVISLLIVL